LLGKTALAYWSYLQVSKKMKCCEYVPWDCTHNTWFSSELIIGPIKLECYITLGQIDLVGKNALAFWSYSHVLKKMKRFRYDPWDCTHNTWFSSELIIGPIKLECYITLGQIGLLGKNALAYWSYSQVLKKMKYFEYDSCYCIHNTWFSSEIIIRPIKLECYITLGQIGLVGKTALAYWSYSQVLKKMKCCEYVPWNCIHNTWFSSELIIGPVKLECFITQSQIGLVGKKALAYWSYSQVLKKVKCFEYDP
jgi:hypothetical protein